MNLEIIGVIVNGLPIKKSKEPLCDAHEVLNAIRNADEDEEIVLTIDSPGGSLTAGIEIYHALKKHPGHVIAKVDGCAASAASMIMCGADTVQVYKSSIVMIHGVQMMDQQISASNIDKLKRNIETIDSAIAEIYVRKTGIEEETIRDWMNPEKWMNGAEAVELGFADELREEENKKKARFEAKARPLTIEEKENLMKDIEKITKLVNECDDKKAVNKNEESEEKETEVVEDAAKEAEDPKTKPDEETKPEEEQDPKEEQQEEGQPSTDPEESDSKGEDEEEKLQNMIAEEIAKERQRIQEIDQLSGMISDKKLLNEAKYGKHPMTAQELAYKVMVNTNKAGKKFLNVWESDVEDSGVNDVDSSSVVDKKVAKAESEKALLKSVVDAVNAGRE